jgi:glycerophosphoryl diester phosphodiesterase
VVVIHDPSLDRTTTGNGIIAEKNYFGYIDSLTTKEEPHCPISRFQDVLNVLIKPENSHIWVVIDIKMSISPEVLETLSSILKSYNEDLSVFSKQLTLGIWHPKFIPYAKTHLPEIPIVHIGVSLEIARNYFNDADGYNLYYASLSGNSGQKFIEEAHYKGKPVFVWTVNEENVGKYCHNWGVDAVMTDKTKVFVNLFKDLKNDEQGERERNGLIPKRRKFVDVVEEDWYTRLSHFWTRLSYYLNTRWEFYIYGGDHYQKKKKE